MYFAPAFFAVETSSFAQVFLILNLLIRGIYSFISTPCAALYHSPLPTMLYKPKCTNKPMPSFSKFARSIGVTLADLKSFCKYEEFKRAYDECNEIRRDYLIDNALCKKFDGSFTKFLLTAELGMGESNDAEDKAFDFTLEVISTEKEKNEV